MSRVLPISLVHATKIWVAKKKKKIVFLNKMRPPCTRTRTPSRHPVFMECITTFVLLLVMPCAAPGDALCCSW